MKIVKLFLPGEYDDVYIYMGRLIGLTVDRRLQIYNLEKMIEQIEVQHHPETIPAPTLLFTRNDWLASEQFKMLMKNWEMNLTFLNAVDVLSKSIIEIVPEKFLVEQKEINLLDPMILDLLIYNGRMFLGATGGLYNMDIDWKSNGQVETKSLQKRHDARCMNLSARNGTVNASCDDEGLISLIDEFRLWDHGSKKNDQKVAEKSLTTSWMNENIINYPSYDHPYLFHSQTGDSNTLGLERERKVVTGVDPQATDLEYLLAQAFTKHKIDENDKVRFVHNSAHRLFIATLSGLFLSLSLKAEEEKEDRKGHNKKQLSLGKDGRIWHLHRGIIATYPCKPGQIVETINTVALVPNVGKQMVELLQGDIVLIRTFPRSKRFQNLVAVIVDEGMFLISVFDEKEIGSHSFENNETYDF